MRVLFRTKHSNALSVFVAQSTVEIDFLMGLISDAYFKHSNTKMLKRKKSKESGLGANYYLTLNLAMP